MALSREEITQIATRTADEVMERVSLEREERELRDHIIGGAMGEGAIPLYGRETRKEPCSGCRIDLDKPLEPGNVMATTEGAIGTLSAREVRNWCSEIIEVTDGRCERARSIREAARECKEKYPKDTAKFFECYAPAFSKITKGSNPGTKEPWQMTQAKYEPLAREGFRQATEDAIARLEEGLSRFRPSTAAYEDTLRGIAMQKQQLVEGVTSEGIRSTHRLLVRKAFLEGKSVPLEVLADYPDLVRGSNPGLVVPIVAATVALQKLEEEKKKPKDAGKMRF